MASFVFGRSDLKYHGNEGGFWLNLTVENETYLFQSGHI